MEMMLAVLLMVAGAAAHDHHNTGLAIPDADKLVLHVHELTPFVHNYSFSDGMHYEEYGYNLDFEKGKFTFYYNISMPDTPKFSVEHTTEMVAENTYECETTLVCEGDKYMMKGMKKMEDGTGGIATFIISGALTMPDGQMYEADATAVDDNGAYTLDMNMPSMTNPTDTMNIKFNGMGFHYPTYPHVLNLTMKSQDSFLSYNAASDLLDKTKNQAFGTADLVLKCITMPEITGSLRIDTTETSCDVNVAGTVDGEKYTMTTTVNDESSGNAMTKKVVSKMTYPNMAPCNMMMTMSMSPESKSFDFDYNGEYGALKMNGSKSMEGQGIMFIDLTSPEIKSTMNIDANMIAKQLMTKLYLEENGAPMLDSDLTCNMIDDQSCKCSMESNMKGDKYIASMEGLMEPKDGAMVHTISGNLMLPNIQRPMVGQVVMTDKPGKKSMEVKLNNKVMMSQNVAYELNGLDYTMNSPMGNAILKMGAFSDNLMEIVHMKFDSVWTPPFAIKMEKETNKAGDSKRMLFNVESDALPTIDMHATCNMVDYDNGAIKLWGDIAGNKYMTSLSKTSKVLPGASGDMKVCTMEGNMELPNMSPMAAKMVVKDDSGNFTVDVTSEQFSPIKLQYYNYETVCNLFLDSEMMNANMTSDISMEQVDNNAVMHFNSRWTPAISLKIEKSMPSMGNGEMKAVLDIGGQEFGMTVKAKTDKDPKGLLMIVNSEITAPNKTPEQGLIRMLMFKGGYTLDAEMSKYWIYPAIMEMDKKIEKMMVKKFMPLEMYIQAAAKRMMKQMEMLG